MSISSLSSISSVACGGKLTMVIASSKLYAIGNNSFGELGLGDTTDRNTFTEVTSMTGIPLSVSCRSQQTALITTHGLFVTGLNASGELGLGNNTNVTTFTNVTITGTPLSVVCGSAYTAIITSEGLFVTGLNNEGQLGLGDTVDRKTFTKVTITGTPLSVACGAAHTALITSDGLFTTGRNSYGHLGLGNIAMRTTFTKVTITGTPLSVSCGFAHTALITTDGLFTTGLNTYGQLGFNDVTRRLIFTQVTINIPETPTSVACGDYHTAVITSSGLFTTGTNGEGQLGLGDTTSRLSFTQVTSMTETPTSISSRGYHIAVITSSGLFTTGWNIYGQLGLGDTTNRKSFERAITIVSSNSYYGGQNANIDGSFACVNADITYLTGSTANYGSIICNKIGIGVTPTVPLEINNKHVPTYLAGPTYSYAYSQYPGVPYSGTTSTSSGFGNLSIKCNGDIWSAGSIVAGASVVASDNRIKTNIISLSFTPQFDLIHQIEPVRYTFKDFIQKGALEDYGFIAQQIKDVIPSSVQLITDYIPNIMDIGNINVVENRVFIKLKTKKTTDIELQENSKIKTFDDHTEILFNLIGIVDEHTIEVSPINNILDNKELFVYGQTVNDFHALDKGPILALNTACVQELHKIVSNQQIQIEELKTKIDFLMSRRTE